MIKKLMAKKLTLHVKIIAEKTAHALALLENVSLQRAVKNVVKEN